MKKTAFFVLLSMCFTQSLFISEYIEGSSYNKAIEIYNPTSVSVDLAGYELWKISNGGDWNEGSGNNVVLSDYVSTIGANTTLVVCSNQAWEEVLPLCDIAVGGQATNFNGDDAVGLAYNGEVIDAVGEEGADPGSGWEVSGVADATKEHTLVRNLSVTSGNMDWASSSSSEWTVFDQNTFDYLGSHGELGDISGCMDSEAANYNPSATVDDGSCLYPSNATLYEIQYSSSATGDLELDCYPSPLSGQIVTVSGVVSAVRPGDYPNFFIQDPNSTSWGGAYVYDTSVQPNVGDEVEITTSILEYFGVTELTDVSSFSTTNTGVDIIPINVSTGDIGLACGESGEQYEGMLVELSNATVELTDEFGSWYLNDGSGMTLVDDYFYNGDDWPAPSAGELFTSIIGVVHYSYGEYRIYPRSISDLAVDLTLPIANAGDDQFVSPGDIVTLDGSGSNDPNGSIVAYEWVQTAGPNVDLSDNESAITTFTPSDAGELSFRLSVFDNDFNEDVDYVNVSVIVIEETSLYDVQYTTILEGTFDNDCYPSLLNGQTVTVMGVVNAVKPGEYPNFFIQDPAGVAWEGAYVYDTTVQPSVGDEIQITASVVEYFGVTELTDVTSFSTMNSGVPVNPMQLSAGDIGLTCNESGEMYEGILVHLSNVTVDSVDEYNTWIVSDGTGSAKIDDYFFDGSWPVPSAGEVYPNIVGVVSYSYGEYKIYPRNSQDFEEVSNNCTASGDINSDGTVNILDVVGIVSFVLGQSNFDDCQIQTSDLNSDGLVNVLDIVGVVNIILGS